MVLPAVLHVRACCLILGCGCRHVCALRMKRPDPFFLLIFFCFDSVQHLMIGDSISFQANETVTRLLQVCGVHPRCMGTRMVRAHVACTLRARMLHACCVWRVCCVYVACMLHACCFHVFSMFRPCCVHVACTLHPCCIHVASTLRPARLSARLSHPMPVQMFVTPYTCLKNMPALLLLLLLWLLLF